MKEGGSVADAVRASGAKRITCQRLNTALKTKNEEALSKLLDRENNRAGRRHVISKPENEMIKERI